MTCGSTRCCWRQSCEPVTLKYWFPPTYLQPCLTTTQCPWFSLCPMAVVAQVWWRRRGSRFQGRTTDAVGDDGVPWGAALSRLQVPTRHAAWDGRKITSSRSDRAKHRGCVGTRRQEGKRRLEGLRGEGQKCEAGRVQVCWKAAVAVVRNYTRLT